MYIYTATHCNTPQHTLQHTVTRTATHWNTPQPTASHCSKLQHAGCPTLPLNFLSCSLLSPSLSLFLIPPFSLSVSLSVSLSLALSLSYSHTNTFALPKYCITLQHIAAQCNTLQHTTSHRNTQ